MYGNLESFLNNWRNNSTYFEMLQLMASISRLFSESATPYLDYRLAENLFCKYYDAQNDARSCTAYDARLAGLGIGIKTFILKNGSSIEKIAEFNKLKPILNELKGKKLAKQIATFRNERMLSANNTYNVSETQYHIVGRQDGLLKVFNTPYEMVDVDSICDVRDKEASISFNDGKNEYLFNKSKSVLQKRFFLPDNHVDIRVNILDEPLDLLASLLKEHIGVESIIRTDVKGRDYVVLPLYSSRGKKRHIPEKSGLNQWNAAGRKRNPNEVYIPIPITIHRFYPDFFPDKDTPFELRLPDSSSISAKVCQSGEKALMSNPNSVLGEWILRKVLRKKEGELVTIEDLNTYGIDSVKLISTHTTNVNGERVYKIVFSDGDYEDYGGFIE